MLAIQQQSKRFLKVKAKLPNTLPNQIFKEADTTNFLSKYKVIGVKSRQLPKLNEIKEASVPYTQNDHAVLKDSLVSLFGTDLISTPIPNNLLINKKHLLNNRLEKPFEDYSKTEKLQQIGNNEHFNLIGTSYANFLSEKYKNNTLNLNKLHSDESTAVLGFLYLINYKNNSLTAFEERLLEKLS